MININETKLYDVFPAVSVSIDVPPFPGRAVYQLVECQTHSSGRGFDNSNIRNESPALVLLTSIKLPFFWHNLSDKLIQVQCKLNNQLSLFPTNIALCLPLPETKTPARGNKYIAF